MHTLSSLVGLRVVRGPDWKWQEQDGGDGHVGTLVSVGFERPTRQASVLWDAGAVTKCRIGSDGTHDLRAFDSAPCGIRHGGVTCDACNATDFAGMRWKCSICFSHDLCTACYMADQHNTDHEFFRMMVKDDDGVRLPPRAQSAKRNSKGLFPGATVVRGRDWRWGDQDERGLNKTGKIVDITDFSLLGVRNAVRVQWSESGTTHVYRVGAGGKVDVQCEIHGDGGSYYPEHLPEVGNKLLELTGGALRLSGHGGIGDLLLPATPGFERGDVVTVISDLPRVMELQEGHGGWVSPMEEIIGKTGKVVALLPLGDLRVKIGDIKWTLNPACCTIAGNAEREAMAAASSSSESSDDESNALPAMLGAALGSGGLFGGGLLGGGLLGSPLGGGLLPGGLFPGGLLPGGLFGSGMLGSSSHMKLVSAIMSDDASAVKEILSLSQAEVNSRVAGMTPLMTAVLHSSSEEILRLLLDAGADVTCTDAFSDTLLHNAVLGRKKSFAKVLLERGVQTEAVNRRGHTPLHIASGFCGEEDTTLVSLLLENGCNPNAQDPEGKTPLQCAIEKGYKAVALVLVEHPGSNLTLKNNAGLNALHQAVLLKDEGTVRAIIRKLPSIVTEQSNNGGMTPLQLAAEHGMRAIADVLIKEGRADVEQLTEHGETALLLAVSRGRKDVAELLLDCGASVFAKDERGDTSLHFAINSHQLLFGRNAGSTPAAIESLDLIKKLLEKGADHTCKNSRGKSAADLATGPKVRALLEQYQRHC